MLNFSKGWLISSNKGLQSTELCSAVQQGMHTKPPQNGTEMGLERVNIVYPVPQCSSVKCYCFPEARNIILP